MNSKENTKLVVIDTVGPIDELGGISGPVVNPCTVTVSTIIRMITSHRKVYEVSPSDTSKRVLLTLQNVNKENFPKPVIKATANIAPTLTNTQKKTAKNTQVSDKAKTESSDTKGDFTKK